MISVSGRRKTYHNNISSYAKFLDALHPVTGVFPKQYRKFSNTGLSNQPTGLYANKKDRAEKSVPVFFIRQEGTAEEPPGHMETGVGERTVFRPVFCVDKIEETEYKCQCKRGNER